MSQKAPIVKTGVHFIDGNEACAEGAIAAGCRFVSGYPISPSTEVVEHLSRRFPEVGGMFIQMEDELSASICFQGAVWAGEKGMTVTSGPGFSLMMEHVGFAAMTETPSVFVNVQRAGPSTGFPTSPAQQDMMQARWGSHGDYEVIAIAPDSPQECFNLIITCFNLAEKYRCPVFFMMDESVGHMHGKVYIPDAKDIEVVDRKNTDRKPGEYLPYKIYGGDVPEMAKVGTGHKLHITGLTHNEKGYPEMTPQVQTSLVTRLKSKILDHAEEISMIEEKFMEDADVAVISYGISARVALNAVEKARAKGVKAGLVRLITIWPFNDKAIEDVAKRVNSIIVTEMNLGQIVHEVERVAAKSVPVYFEGNAGSVTIDPDYLADRICEVAK
ncbi:MAG: 2-oxoacid:acceptor oxidoreductase subunit alpha [Deltaproteobacteria bacterium]|nr:2-oxoacid:acceptor oxidoreductase subunit alpha [Deltaproteobacteria bacterium]